MGLIDFVKNAGQNLLDKVGLGGPKEAQAEVLTKEVHDLGIEVGDLRVDVDGEVATISGTAMSQAEREKAIIAIGNTKGISQVDDQIITEDPTPPATYYTVVSGDTLSKIAKALYGDASKYPVIFEANRPMLSDPDKIYPGQSLRIPPL